MFRFKHLAAAAAAVAMAATPVVASAANPAASLSVARAGSETKADSNISGANATLINLGIFAAIVAGILLIATTGDDDSPDSP